MAQKMKITANAVLPSQQPAAKDEAIVVSTDSDCTVVLGKGLSVKLGGNQTCTLIATTKGHHKVETVKSNGAAGPTGDIYVPG